MAFDALEDPALEEPLLPLVRLSDSFEGELELSGGELLDSPASEPACDFSTPEESGFP